MEPASVLSRAAEKPPSTCVGVSARSALGTSACARRAIRPKQASFQPPPSESNRSARGRLPKMTDVTRILSAIEHGDPHAAEQLLPLVYDELRKMAAQKLLQEKPGQTLDATALVHEAYLRLMDAEGRKSWEGRGHFFASAAEAMRRILIDSARRKRRPKHGGDRHRVDLDDAGD